MSSFNHFYTFPLPPPSSSSISNKQKKIVSFFSLSLSLQPATDRAKEKMKGGKLTKLKSALKNWPSFTTRNSNEQRRIRNSSDAGVTLSVPDNDEPLVPSADEKLQAVYVGRCRRQYFVTSEVINHPLFQVLVDKSELGSGGSGEGGIIVACEVVMFDHLLWMLENTDSSTQLDPNSMDELVEFYSF
ncbi:auxin-responsive protein SAUR76-like [Impatiens glandulifera]|uniref:auxin-responsive protein SAUR76-like n=1 Tax=Impatiens glandulifera TaxID=253017 RepID=UPI001FB0920F|nr:auxin-responsive protein SAUR76-like [Impatiens glandulifera]